MCIEVEPLMLMALCFGVLRYEKTLCPSNGAKKSLQLDAIKLHGLTLQLLPEVLLNTKSIMAKIHLFLIASFLAIDVIISQSAGPISNRIMAVIKVHFTSNILKNCPQRRINAVPQREYASEHHGKSSGCPKLFTITCDVVS